MNSSGGAGASSSSAVAARSAAGSLHQTREALALRAVADLVVILQEVDERGRRQSGAGSLRAARRQ